MGCFFACFRIRDDSDRRNKHMLFPTSNKREPVVLNNQLSSAYLREEKGSPDGRVGDWRSAEGIGKDDVDEELKREAKFLKSIGTLQETPAEIRKMFNRTNGQTSDEDSLPSNSFRPGTPCKKLDWDKQLAQVMNFPAQQEKSDLGENKHGGGLHEEYQTLKDKQSQLESGLKSITLDTSPTQSESSVEPFVSCYSPYPTPINLSEEMQTPGTIYPSSIESVRAGKDARIHTQYVYPVLNPVENLSQWKALRGDTGQSVNLCDLYEKQINSSNPAKKMQHFLPSLFKDSEGIPKTPSPAYMKNQIPTVHLKEESVNDKSSKLVELTRDSTEQVCFNSDCPEFVVSSLSNWLRPPPPKDERKNSTNIAKEQHSERSRETDRPIIGLVAAHWNNDDPGQISHRWWDGNGIPNSTNKYKEDQKVSWHATPFEERLEKALSDEKLFPQRKVRSGKPIEFEDDEESDTALS